MHVLLEYLLPFVKVGGMCICMKGPNVSEEIKDIENVAKKLGAQLVETENLKLLNGEIERNIIILKKIKNTDKKYPRKAGTPSKQPL